MAPKKTTTSKKSATPKTVEHKGINDLKALDRVELSQELDSARRELYILVMKKNL